MQPPAMPERPPKPEEKSSGGVLSFLYILMAGFLGLIILVVLGGLLVATLGVGLAPFIVVAGIFALAGVHYLLWGRWLGEIIRREAENNSDE